MARYGGVSVGVGGSFRSSSRSSGSTNKGAVLQPYPPVGAMESVLACYGWFFSKFKPI
jgi:hypothetical protein